MFSAGIMPVIGLAMWAKVLIIVLIVVAILLGVLYYFGNKLQKQQIAQKEQMDAMAQVMSMLIIDKKVMRLNEAPLPKEVLEQAPKYMRKSKVPVVKAKVGPRVMTLLADPKVFEVIPTKKEIKAVVSGIYITEIKSVRGGSIPQPAAKEKKGLAKLFSKKKK